MSHSGTERKSFRKTESDRISACPAPDGEELTARLEGLVRLIEAPALPALVRAALVHAEMVVIRPFTAGNAAVGRLLVRHLIARDGLE